MSGFSFGPPKTTSAFSFSGISNTSTASTQPTSTGLNFSFSKPTASSTGTSLFPTFSAPSTSSTAFGGFTSFKPTTSTSTGSFNLLGQNTANSVSTGLNLFSGFGNNTSTSGGLGTGLGFGAPTNTTFTLGGGNQLQQQQQTGATYLDTFTSTLTQPLLFGDERDLILARWNRLQARWGTGTGFSSKGKVTYTPENFYANFKAVVYNLLPTSQDSDGYVVLTINKKSEEVIAQAQQVQDTLFRILGNKPNLQIQLDDIRPSPMENKSEIVIRVVEKLPMGGTRNIAASELASFLSQMTTKNQLESQLAVQHLKAQMAPSPAQISQYLERPPSGLAPDLWQQGIVDNPNQERYLPVPMVGLKELCVRLQGQEDQVKRQSGNLQKQSSTINQLKTGQINIESKIDQLKRKQVELSHRVLKVVCRQEINRKQGYSLLAEEEALRYTLERVWTELVAAYGVKGRLREVLSGLKMSDPSASVSSGGNIAIKSANAERADASWDMETLEELKEHLKRRQEGISEMIEIIKEDKATIEIVDKEMQHNIQRPKSPRSLW